MLGGFDFSHGICLKILPKWYESGVFSSFWQKIGLNWNTFGAAYLPLHRCYD